MKTLNRFLDSVDSLVMGSPVAVCLIALGAGCAFVLPFCITA